MKGRQCSVGARHRTMTLIQIQTPKHPHWQIHDSSTNAKTNQKVCSFGIWWSKLHGSHNTTTIDATKHGRQYPQSALLNLHATADCMCFWYWDVWKGIRGFNQFAIFLWLFVYGILLFVMKGIHFFHGRFVSFQSMILALLAMIRFFTTQLLRSWMTDRWSRIVRHAQQTNHHAPHRETGIQLAVYMLIEYKNLQIHKESMERWADNRCQDFRFEPQDLHPM